MKNKLPLIVLGLLIAFAAWQNQPAPEQPVQPKLDPNPVLPWPMPEPEPKPQPRPMPRPCPGPI